MGMSHEGSWLKHRRCTHRIQQKGWPPDKGNSLHQDESLFLSITFNSDHLSLNRKGKNQGLESLAKPAWVTCHLIRYPECFTRPEHKCKVYIKITKNSIRWSASSKEKKSNSVSLCDMTNAFIFSSLLFFFNYMHVSAYAQTMP